MLVYTTWQSKRFDAALYEVRPRSPDTICTVKPWVPYGPVLPMRRMSWASSLPSSSTAVRNVMVWGWRVRLA